MSAWWLTIRIAGTIRCWDLGDPDPAAREDLIFRAQILAGVPHDHDPLLGLVTFAPGEPHPRTLAAATVHTVDELRQIPRADVDAYRAAVTTAARTAHVRDAKRVLDALGTEDRAAVLAQYVEPQPVPEKRQVM